MFRIAWMRIAAGIVASGIFSAANAVTVSATATLDFAGSPATTDSQTSPTAANAELIEQELFSGLLDREIISRGYADSDGQLGASASYFGVSGPSADEISAIANWTESFTATASSTAQFDFFIPQAGIGFAANNVDGLSGSFSVEITLNGTPVFFSSAQVTSERTSNFDRTPDAPENVPLVLSGEIIDAAPGFETGLLSSYGLPGGAGWLFDAFAGSLLLAPLEGENILSYTMRSSVSGFIGETAAIAFIGDPLALSQGGDPANPGVTLTSVNAVSAVPLPAGVWLFGTALACLIGMGRRRKLK